MMPTISVTDGGPSDSLVFSVSKETAKAIIELATMGALHVDFEKRKAAMEDRVLKEKMMKKQLKWVVRSS